MTATPQRPNLGDVPSLLRLPLPLEVPSAVDLDTGVNLLLVAQLPWIQILALLVISQVSPPEFPDLDVHIHGETTSLC
jgi:hypothetical protein